MTTHFRRILPAGGKVSRKLSFSPDATSRRDNAFSLIEGSEGLTGKQGIPAIPPMLQLRTVERNSV